MADKILTPRAENFPRWYQDVIARAQLADNGPVRGTMVIRPTGYAIWERLQSELNAKIVATGCENAYFPLFIPESYLHKEAEHVEGFSPELAVVTHGGGKKLEEPVVVRPTSETIINESFSRWIQSYRDLPLKVNNWSNVVRWELRPRLFLRTTEFLWQEGHTCHASAADARAYSRQILHDVYMHVMTEIMAIPVIAGIKTNRERFAGATHTLTCEGMMGDGKALQMGTSHELGQNFARAFDVDYLTNQGNRDFVWQTSWGVSTRLIGGLIMCHGDDHGLRIPPRLAPVQVLVCCVKGDDAVISAAKTLVSELVARGIRTKLDDRTDITFGRRAIDVELRGIPVRIDVGPRDLAQEQVTIVRRIPGEKSTLALSAVADSIPNILEQDQEFIYDQAITARETRIRNVSSISETVEATSGGWARISWDELGVDGENELAQQGVSVRCLTRADGSLPDDVNEPGLTAYIARAY